MKNLPSKVSVECPYCGYMPKNATLFFAIPLSNYQMGHKRLMGIKCRHYLCTFTGDIIEWMQLKTED